MTGTPVTGETYNIDKGGTVIGTGEGQLVTGFGTGGYALFSDDPKSDVPGRVRVRSDGRILAAGGIGCVVAVPADAISPFRCTLQLAQYTASGAPDATFGTNGRIVTAVTNVDPEVNLQIQSDGTSYVQRHSLQRDRERAVRSQVHERRCARPIVRDERRRHAGCAAGRVPVIGSLVEASGRVVVVATTPDTGVGEREDIFVTRLTSAGVTDTTFGTNGVAQFALSTVDNRSDRGTAIDIQPDGKIIVGGRTRVTSGARLRFPADANRHQRRARSVLRHQWRRDDSLLRVDDESWPQVRAGAGRQDHADRHGCVRCVDAVRRRAIRHQRRARSRLRDGRADSGEHEQRLLQHQPAVATASS